MSKIRVPGGEQFRAGAGRFDVPKGRSLASARAAGVQPRKGWRARWPSLSRLDACCSGAGKGSTFGNIEAPRSRAKLFSTWDPDFAHDHPGLTQRLPPVRAEPRMVLP